MNTKIISIILILMPCLMRAQLTESFTDGNFTSNPEWIGDAPQFKVNTSFELQLNSSGDNSSCLATAVAMSDSMEWNFWVKLSFSPSDNNLAKIYLMADKQDLKNSLNGYYIKLGESGSNDAIELLKQSGNVNTSLCRGTPGLIANSFAIRIRVIRSKTGLWKVFADPAGGQDYKPEGTATDNTFSSSSWFGVLCKYTSSNSTKFYFDDIYGGPVIIDHQPPELRSVSLLSANGLSLQFSETVDSTSSSQLTNYSVDRGIGQPSSASRNAEDHSRVTLAFSGAFASDISYIITVSSVTDLAGNPVQPTQFPFTLHKPKTFDVLINELMVDPDPPVSLPGFEYLELFNRSVAPIDLSGWSIMIGSSIKPLPSYTLPAGGYVILADDDTQQVWATYGPVISFSSFSLVNTGTTVTLKDADEYIIHSVTYTEDWYHSEYKKEGGWSLEQIDPANPCGEAANWMASNDVSGGTPGRVNSVNAANPDHQLPSVVRIGIIDPLHLSVIFSEQMDSIMLSAPLNYSIDHEVGNPVGALAVAPGYRQVEIELATPIAAGTVYTLTLSGSFTDCAGNMLPASSSARFAIPAQAEPLALIINEILFDPAEGCADFVELFNRSSDVVDLRDLTLAAYDTTTKVLTSISDISPQSYLMFPGDYYVLTTDTAAIKHSYHTTNPNGFIQMNRLPSMNNDAGSIALALKTGSIIDHVAYTATMQYPLLTNTEGVSLERISPGRPSNDVSNWHSAAESAGFATPAYKNSQFGITENTRNEISLSPDIFSPDNDGNYDNLNIEYSFGTPGYNITITIYDATGHLIRNLVSNELCGTSGTYTWDGITNNRLKASIGRYLVFVEVFDLQGNVAMFKKATVLGGKL